MKTSIKSIVGTVVKNVGGLNSAFSANEKTAGPTLLNIKGKDFYVGDFAKKYTRNPVSNLSGDHFVDPNMLLPLTYASLSGLADDEHISAVISLPIATMMNSKLYENTTAALKKMLLGKHEYEIYGSQKHLNIDSIDFLAQGAAAFYSDVFNGKGELIMDAAYLGEKHGVIDIGFGTLDLFTLEDGEINASGTSGYDLGVHYPTYELQAQIRRDFSIDISQEMAVDCVTGTRKVFYHEAKPIPVQPYVDEVLDIWVAEIESMLQRHMADGKDYASLYFCGGGSSVIADRLQAKFPHGHVLSDPIFANAIGCYRFGMAKKRQNPIGIDPGFYAYKVARKV